jgi:hypothetical protein
MRKVLLLCAVMTQTAFAQGNNEWFGFAPYPGARQLCNQVVMGQPGGAIVEIHWRSYATSDGMAKVVAFFEKQAKDVEKSPDSITFRLDKDTTLSVQAGTSSGYPKCDTKPKSDEKTVIVVSRATRR